MSYILKQYDNHLAYFDVYYDIEGFRVENFKIVEINNKGYDATNKENSVLETLKIALEATARGIRFGKVDVMRSHSSDFLIDDDEFEFEFLNMDDKDL